MKQPDPILAHKLKLTSPKFKNSLVGWIRRFVEGLPRGSNARQIEGENFTKKSAALDALAGFIGELPIEDPRLFALAKVAANQPDKPGWSGRQDFEPTLSQRRLFYQQGLGAPIAPETTLMHLVLAGLHDTLAAHTRARQQLENESKQADVARTAAEAKVEPLAEVEAERTRLTGKLDAAQQQIAKLQERAVDLEGFLVASGDNGAARRQKVEGQTGIYQALSREYGLVYEIGYNDAEGKQRWRRLDPDASIEAARRLRRQLAGQPHEPDPADVDGSGDDAAEDVLSGDADPAEASQDAGDQETTPEPVAAGGE